MSTEPNPNRSTAQPMDVAVGSDSKVPSCDGPIPIDDPNREPIEVLADEFIERHRAGESPTIEEYVKRYPVSADEIRELFPTIAAMEQLKFQKQKSSGGRATLAGAKLEQLGDFRIIGEIGRGGMGIVYEAEQESLGRHVAVKVLPRQSLLEERHLKRFEREAKTAAGLHHTNIVPIFGVGEQDGYHYYVMQFIRGVGLDAVIAHLGANGEAGFVGNAPSSAVTVQDFRTSDVEQIAAALLQGKFQRPRAGDSSFNSGIIGNNDPTAIVNRNSTVSGSQIVDATEVKRSIESDQSKQDVTENGANGRSDRQPQNRDIVQEASSRGPRCWQSIAKIGVQVADALAYAHEQGTLHRDIKPANLLLDPQGIVWITDFGLAKAMQHDDVSGSGDIVGTLRYMAPEQLRGEADHRSDIYSLGLTLYELLTFRPAHADVDRRQLIMQPNTYVEPTRPRRLNPSIPLDLETIVLKAIAVEPHDRYQTAGELEADLHCFLEDRPIQARRASMFERFGRWCRRNPAVASTSLTSLALLILVAVMATFGYYERGERNRTIKAALDGETAQREKAEATSALAWNALDKVMNRFAPSRSLTISERTIEDEGGEQIEIPTQLVLSNESAALLEELLQVYDDLAAQGDDDPQYLERIAEANHRVGDIRQRLGNHAEARTAYTKAIKLLNRMKKDSADSISTKTKIAMIYNELGTVNRLTQQRDAADKSFQTALRILTAIIDSIESAPPEVRYELARTYFLSRPRRSGFGGSGRRGNGERAGEPGPNRPRPGLKERRPRPGEKRRGSPERPRPPERDRGREPIANNLPKAIDILKELVNEYPNAPDYQHLLARCYRASIWMHRRDRERTKTAIANATASLERLVEKFPQVPDYRYDLSEIYASQELSIFSRSASEEKLAESAERLETALRISEELVSEHPNVPAYLSSQVHTRLKLAMAQRRLKQGDAATESLEKAVTLQSLLVKRHPEVRSYRFTLAFITHSLGRRYLEQDELQKAEALFRQAIATFEALVEKEPRMRYPLRYAYQHLANILKQSDDPIRQQEAEEYKKKATELSKPESAGSRKYGGRPAERETEGT